MVNRVFVCFLCVVLLSMGLPIAVAQDAPVELVYGQTVEGSLSDAQPSIFYEFDAETGDVVTITMIAAEGPIDPFLVLNDANRSPLTTDDNSGEGSNARLTFVIPVTGRYVIQATHAGGVLPEGGGGFSLNLTAAVDGQEAPTAEAPEEAATSEPTAAPSDGPTTQGDSVRLAMLQPGTTVRDTLDRQVAFRLYWIEAQEGDQIAVTPEQLGDFQPLLALYNGRFEEIQRTGPGTSLRTTLPAAGVYFLSVALPDTGSAGGAYGFVFDLIVNPATQGDFIDISYGETQRGNIDASVPAMTYRFRGSASDAVTITMSRAGGDLNSYLSLLDGSGQLLYEDNDSGGENGDALILYTLPADGEYLIVATRLGQTQGTTSGSYLLELQSDAAAPPPDEVQAEPVLPPDYEGVSQLAYGETVDGELSNDKFMDVYVFLGSEGDTITLEMESQNADLPNGLDPLLVLLDDGRIPLVENDDIVEGVERDSRIEFTLPQTAYYAVVATRFDQADGVTIGPYTLTLGGPTETPEEAVTVEDETLLAKLSTVTLQPGVPAQETFEAGATLYTFTGAADSLIDLSVTTDPGLDSVLILADKNLDEILSSGTGALTGITLPQAGRYLVILAPRFGPVNESGGGYILALTQAGAEAETGEPAAVEEGPRTISYGETVSGVIDDSIVSQIYTFTGAAGERVRITMEAAPGSSLDCYLELQDANNVTIDASDDIDPGVIRDSQIVIELPADGEYSLIASRYVGDDAELTSGAYRLSLERVDDLPGGGGVSTVTVPISYGESLVGEVTDEQYLLFYVFDGTAGDVITVEVDNLSGNLDSVLYLYQSTPSGWVEIVSNDDSPIGGTYEAMLSQVVLPQTSKYLIAVGRYGLERESTFGSFSITLTRES